MGGIGFSEQSNYQKNETKSKWLVWESGRCPFGVPVYPYEPFNDIHIERWSEFRFVSIKSNFSRGTLGNEDSQLLNAHNNFLKTQSDGLKCELSVREAEISSLKTRLESTERTNHENRMHLEGILMNFTK